MLYERVEQVRQRGCIISKTRPKRFCIRASKEAFILKRRQLTYHSRAQAPHQGHEKKGVIYTFSTGCIYTW